MTSPKAREALSFRTIGRADLPELLSIQLDDSQLDWFAPVSEIVSEAARNPDRIPVAIHAGSDLIGFFIFHRDRRDSRCWWLAWFLIDKRQQGRGFGKAAFRRILAHIARREGCLRIRLQVTPGNRAARGIYVRAGFRDTGRKSGDGDDILEIAISSVTAPLHRCCGRPSISHRGMGQASTQRIRLREHVWPPKPWIGFAPVGSRTGPIGMPPPGVASVIT